MKFSINKSSLQEALSVVTKGAATHATLPILSGVYMQSDDDTLILQTTDLDRSIRYTVPALIEEPGEIVVPVKLFADIIKTLPDAAVFFEVEDMDATIHCESSTFSLKTMNAADFPGFPEVEAENEISLPFNTFSPMVKKVAKIVSHDESRAILTGVYISAKENELKMVATDSYRLGVVAKANMPEKNDFSAVIAGGFLAEVASLPNSEDPIRIAFSANQILVTYQNTVFVNRRIEGNFPDFNQLIATEHSTTVIFETKPLITTIKRIALMSGNNSQVRLDIDAQTNSVQLSSTTQDVGSAVETIKAEVEGESVEIGFNASYIIDGLSVISSDTVSLELQSSMKPGIFNTPEPENFLYLVMPVRL